MVDFDWPLPLRFLLALGLAFLVGLERESSALISKGRVFAGVRTYALIGTFGFGCALLRETVPLMLPIGMVALGSLAVVGYLAKLREGHVGWTSEVAAIITFVMGALCLMADIWVPMAIGIITTLLLSEKAKIEKFVENLDKTEFHAVVRFLIVSVIILPALPDQGYTEFNLNPHHTWRVVVLVSSIGFAGYFLAKRLGDRLGLWMSGLLGGIVSSTAVSIAAGRIAARSPERGRHALQASIIASSVMYLRVLVLVWILQPGFAGHIWPKLLILAAIGAGVFFTVRSDHGAAPRESVEPLRNPFEIRPALLFATLYVLLSVVTVMVTRFYGNAGLIALAGLVGVTDIDPFILSLVSQSADFQRLLFSAILVSMMSNTLVKGFYFGFVARQTRAAALWRYGLWAALHVPVILIG
ncbi:MAG: MgtC/SapB family protein [Candidatus Zixiibacteriota bacterium]